MMKHYIKHFLFTFFLIYHAITTNALNNSVNNYHFILFDENEMISDVKIYPTKIENTIHLEFYLHYSNNIKIEVYSLLGEKVYTYTQTYFLSGNHKIQIDATNLISGAYFIKIYNDTYAKTVRLIK